MKFRRFFAAIAVIAIFIAAYPAAATALWLNDDAIEIDANMFQCSGPGKLEIRFFDAEGAQLNFYRYSDEFFVDDASLKGAYLNEGLGDEGDFLQVYEYSPTARIMYKQETFGHFELTAIPETGYILDRFTDSSCGCLTYLESIDGVYQVTVNTEKALEAVFKEDPDWVNSSPTLNMTLNGKPIDSDVPPFILNDRTMVPVRFISEALGSKAEWDNETKTVTITGEGLVIKLISGDPDMQIISGDNIVIFPMDVSTTIKDGRAFVPVRFIAEALGLIIRWNGQTKTVAFLV